MISLGTPTLDVDFTVGASGSLTLQGDGSLIIAPNGRLSMTGPVNFNNRPVTLRSDASGTASIGQVAPNSLNGATNVTVERYIPARRAWRLLTAPLKGTTNNSLFYNWQNNGTNVAGTGVHLWHPDGTVSPTNSNNGLFNGPQPNIWSHNGSWADVTNTNSSTLFNTTINNPYLVFVTGAHANTSIMANGAENTTLKPTGTLITGTISHTLTANQFKLIPNPYASPLNIASLLGTNQNTKIWLLNPTTNLGAYETFDGVNWAPQTPSASDQLIQSGQAFFVRSAQGGNFEINETHKTNGFSNNWFARQTTQNLNENKIRVLLEKQNNTQWGVVDGILSVSGAAYSDTVSGEDALKISNFNENIMFRNDTSNLAIEYRNWPILTTVQTMRLTGTTAIPYRLRVFTEVYNSTDVQPVLEDTQSGTVYPIPLDGSEVIVPFTGVVSNASTPDTRFRISYQNIALNSSEWDTQFIRLFPNPMENETITLTLPSAITEAKYQITNTLGQVILNDTWKAETPEIQLRNHPAGVYIITVSHQGKTYSAKLIKK